MITITSFRHVRLLIAFVITCVAISFFVLRSSIAENPSVTRTFYVSSSVNDARTGEDQAFTVLNAPTQYLGKYQGVDYWNGWRFEGVSIPKGAIIESALLDLYAAGLGDGTRARIIIEGEQNINPAPFSSSEHIADRDHTQAAGHAIIPVSYWTATQGFGVNRIDVTDVISEIVKNTTWQDGGAIALIGHDDGSDDNSYVGYSTYDRSSDRGARLIVTYTMPATLANITLPALSATQERSPEPTQSTSLIGTIKETLTGSKTSNDSWHSYAMAWVYPGAPACNAANEYRDGRVIHFLKPEYFSIRTDGSIALLTQAQNGCNGYSPQAAADIRAHSTYQFVVVSGNINELHALVSSPDKRNSAVQTLATFVAQNQFTGVELDFEGFNSWSSNDYDGYKSFIGELGNALHTSGHKLMVDLPPIGSDLEQSYYPLTYQDVAKLPADYLVIMAYDYQYDYGVGQPIAPTAWVGDIISWAKRTIGDTDRIVIGLPSYGYYGQTGSYTPTLKSVDELTDISGISAAGRDNTSYERIWNNRGTSYIFQDQESLNAKRAFIESKGIKYISVWHLGGNPWFSGKSELPL